MIEETGRTEADENADIEESLQALSKRHGSDAALDVAAIAASFAPWIGGPVSDVLSGIATGRKFERVKDVLLALAGDLGTLHTQVAEEYVKTEEFADLLEQTLRQAMDERNPEKRARLRQLLVNVIHNPALDDSDLPRAIRMLSELNSDQLCILQAVAAAPGDSSEGPSPLQALVGRVPNIEIPRVLDLIGELNELRLTRIDHLPSMTGKGSSDLRSYLTLLGQKVAALASRPAGASVLAPTVSSPSGASLLSGADAWRAVVGNIIELDPLFGIPTEVQYPHFVVAEVSRSDVLFRKQSNGQDVRLPLHALSPPWGKVSERNLRASIQTGRLEFDDAAKRWRWHSTASA